MSYLNIESFDTCLDTFGKDEALVMQDQAGNPSRAAKILKDDSRESMPYGDLR